METIEFKRKGFLYHLTKFIFVNDPNDTCSYRLQIITSFLVSIFTLHASILRSIPTLLSFEYRNESDFHGLKPHLIYFMSSVASLMVGHEIIENEVIFNDFIHWRILSTIEIFLYSFIILFIGAITLTLAVLIISFLTFICIQFFEIVEDSTFSYKYFKNDEPNTQLGILYRSFKEKWCKRINWK